jgi:exosome complex component RRP42
VVEGGAEMNVQNAYIASLIEKGKRLDGRKFDDMRNIKITKNPYEQAEGSALVELGDTKVLVGVKMGVGEPFPDTPKEGVLMVNGELSPLAHEDFELGPPREDAIELARVVDRGIRESKTIDVEKLCIREGELVWMVFIDIQPLSHYGNLIDAAGIAAITALKNARMPKLEDDKVVFGEHTKKSLPVTSMPIPVTFAYLNGNMLSDPHISEESAMTGRLTVTTTEKGNVCALQKGGPAGLTIKNIEDAIDISIKKGKDIRKLVQ